MDKRRRVWGRVLDERGESSVDEIYSSYSSEKEKTLACSDAYVNSRPESSWEHLTTLLYEEDEMTAVDQAKPFLPPRGKCITSKQHLMLVGGNTGHGCRLDSTCGDRGHMCHTLPSYNIH